MNIDKEIIETLNIPNVKSIACDIMEIGLDQIIDDELIQKIPIIGSLSKIYDLVSSIRDRIFLKKLAAFLATVDTISDEEKLTFYHKFGTAEDNKIGEKVLFAIERVESIEKSKMIGKLFKCLILGYLELDEFEKCVFSITQLFIGDFKFLLEHPKNLQHVNPPITERLYQHELFERPWEIIDENGSVLNGKKYILSTLGVKFVNAVYDKKLLYKSYSKKELSELLDLK